MRPIRLCLALVALSLVAASASADLQFDTETTADQTITSPLARNGSIDLKSTGTQHFTIDLIAGTANVTSAFTGSDFYTALSPDPFTYSLYNTTTAGTVTFSGGLYTIAFPLLFELAITGGNGGVLNGVVFNTIDPALFQTTVASFPFPNNTVFGDPNRPNDPVTLYLKSDPNGALAAMGVNVGDPVGASTNRVVTILRSVPEPSALLSVAVGAGLIGAFGLRKKQARRAA